MVSGKEHTIFDDDEMIEHYISDITSGFQKTLNTGHGTIIISKIEEYRVELDTNRMS